ncbi:hypothetical protein A2533_05035 [Candidatus Falkowbacteria bacterium RIFOXYD2_FULL_35_9]|uniref:Uncharacterized protein n=1 Tax=Candidatus Falkowbacteria bacterium RIFOXYC2_FULL_36_12 TaxID=1798002 RepID=A0A1F5SZV0_9BACT|nr:MAG: hypothetical protein A2478_02885 [Candidatus Falkowbacteria bacterium RIFOXYC2_FULL_36_12]OGF46424.1 MAG: hypothetical protein A2533_05035 [Candidatus Falkowbacteria bacterium RIFOXYD2_FULL_35_9]
MNILGMTLQTIGEVIIALMVMLVHHRMKVEKKIDIQVSRIMKSEQIIGLIAIAFMLAGFILQVVYEV